MSGAAPVYPVAGSVQLACSVDEGGPRDQPGKERSGIGGEIELCSCIVACFWLSMSIDWCQNICQVSTLLPKDAPKDERLNMASVPLLSWGGKTLVSEIDGSLASGS